jgi:hypothetical protein
MVSAARLQRRLSRYRQVLLPLLPVVCGWLRNILPSTGLTDALVAANQGFHVPNC